MKYKIAWFILLFGIATLRAEKFYEVGIDFPIPDSATRLAGKKAAPNVGETWMERQFLAQWQTADGTAFFLRQVLFTFPEDFTAACNFDYYDAAEPNVDPENIDSVLDAIPAGSAVLIAQNSFNVAKIYRVEPSEQASAVIRKMHTYLIRTFSQKNPWLLLQIASDKKEPEIRDFLNSEIFPKIKELRGNDTSDEPVASLHRIVWRSMRHAKWWIRTTGNCILTGDSEFTADSLTELFQTKQAALHKLYKEEIPPLTKDLPDVFIRIVGNNSLYAYYTGDFSGRTAGVYSPVTKELTLRVGRNIFETESVLRHESFHQYLDAAWQEALTAPWFNEGHAVYFQHMKYDETDEKFKFVVPSSYADLINKDLDAIVEDLPAFLNMNYSEFYSKGTRSYATAWAWITMLRRGAINDKDKSFTQILPRYRQAIADGLTGGDAVAYAIEGISAKKLKKRFYDFWTKESAKLIEL